MRNLKIIDDTYELIGWLVPKVNKFPRNHKFLLGDEIIRGWYDILKQLIHARYQKDKRERLLHLNTSIECQRHFLRLAHDFSLLDTQGYRHVSERVDEIGKELGGWIKSLRS